MNEENSRHIVTVLRMRRGERLRLTDGRGNLVDGELASDHKKHCQVRVLARRSLPAEPLRITLAVSLIKNVHRFEWLLEKVTELGVSVIQPLLCARTERTQFRPDRMKGILVSAMLQSQQCWLPELREPAALESVIRSADQEQKFIAHCLDGEKRSLPDLVNGSLPTKIILVGPEGDFTAGEVDLAVRHHFLPVTLGETRLRAETAGMVAAVLLRHV